LWLTGSQHALQKTGRRRYLDISRPHRHSRARRQPSFRTSRVELEREGATVSTIRDLLGHSSAAVTPPTNGGALTSTPRNSTRATGLGSG
jgi:hypothetical protein